MRKDVPLGSEYGGWRLRLSHIPPPQGRAHLWMILTGAPGSGPRVGSNIDYVNALISAADANAISLKRLDKPTGLKVRVGKF